MNKHMDAPYGGLSGVPSVSNPHAGLRKGKATFANTPQAYRELSRKRRNAARKAAQHRANVATRRQMNIAADKSNGKNPRPFPSK